MKIINWILNTLVKTGYFIINHPIWTIIITISAGLAIFAIIKVIKNR